MITEFLVDFIVKWISAGGYFAVFFLMMLESMVAPVPSEAVMPFAGFLVERGKFTMTGVVLASGIGSLTGSLLSYFLGLRGGRVAVLRLGKYLLIDEGHLEWTQRFFDQYGEATILIGRFIPAVRHLISIPAGMGRMNLPKFAFYTILGSMCWNFILVYTGLKLKERWEVIHKYSEYIDILVIFLLFVFAVYFLKRHLLR